MTEPIEPRHTAQQDQARAMALQCAPILMAAYQIAEQATDTDQTRKLLMDQCVRDGWSALEAMALAIEMMRRAVVAEREHKKLRSAIESEQTKGALERQAVVDAARAWYEAISDQPGAWTNDEDQAMILALESLPNPPKRNWERP